MLRAEQDFFKSIEDREYLQNFVFNYEGIINDEDLEDIWSIYQIEEQADKYRSLYDCLYSVKFNSKSPTKQYDIEHNGFYNMLVEDNGLKHLAKLIQSICYFLDQIADMRMIYGNIKPENIMIKFDEKNEKIENVKFINFGAVIQLENAS